ncbi:MAG: response regulator [Verrucomicrobiota bacterium]|nr:response regulator [Verrucomicrobiota bacterium]
MTSATQPHHILCVDDDLFVRSLVSDTLGAEGYQVQTALDGAHALQKIAMRDRPYDVLIVDARMPNLDGCRFIMQARAGGYKRKIIVFSAHLDADEVQRYRELKIDRLIEKPPRAGELLEAVRELTAVA